LAVEIRWEILLQLAQHFAGCFDGMEQAGEVRSHLWNEIEEPLTIR
jgi:hypothetical protein